MISQLILNASDEDKMNFVLPYGIGDSLMVCLRKDILERKHNVKLKFIVKPNQASLMDLLGVTDYSVVDFSPYRSSEKQELLALGMKYEYPTIGKPFVAHCAFIPRTRMMDNHMKRWKNFNTWFADFLEVSSELQYTKPNTPNVSEEFKTRIQSLSRSSDLSHVVMMLPQATTIKNVSSKHWEKIVKVMSQRGFTVIANSPSGNSLYGATGIACSISELFYACCQCHSVYALRSGFCDLLSFLGSKLHVSYNQNKWLYTFFSLNSIFGRNDIDEHFAFVT